MTLMQYNMRIFSSNLTNLLACCLLLLFGQVMMQAQTASCDEPGNFVLTPPEGTEGSGTADDPYVICQDQPICFESEGVDPTLGFPNPGLVFTVYLNPPTATSPEDEPSANLLFALSDEDGAVINNGCGIFINGAPVTDSLTVSIVPVIVPNIANPSVYDENCTSINLDFDYPVVTIVNPDVFPNCTISEEVCPTTVDGTVDGQESVCSEGLIDLTALQANIATDSDETATFTWFDADGNEVTDPSQVEVLSNDVCAATEYSFSLVIGCTTDETISIGGGTHIIIVWPAFLPPTVAQDEGCCFLLEPACPDDLLSVNDFCADPGTAGVEIVTVESSAGSTCETLLVEIPYSCDDLIECEEVITSFTFNFDQGCSPITNEPILTLVLEGTATEYEMSGDIDGLLPGFLFPFDLVIANNDTFSITATDPVSNCSQTITGIAPTCEPVDTCAANAGMLIADEFTCAEASILLESAGQNQDLAYTQLFILTDTELNIIEVNGTGVFEAEPGSYLGHALNVLTTELMGVNPEDLAGLNAEDVLAGLSCFDLSTSDLLVVLTPIEISYFVDECNTNTGIATVLYSFSGGLPQYAIENGSNVAEHFFYEATGEISGLIEVEPTLALEHPGSSPIQLELVDFQ